MKHLPEQKGLVYYNQDAWNTFTNYLAKLRNVQLFVIVDENTEKYCLPYFVKNVKTENEIKTITIPAGEVFKNIETCVNAWNTLSEEGADRASIIINLGGGVVTDLGGFVASTFKRGLHFINIPTTLLAMVDASVGGKNGVDLGYIKNQIGVINLPEMVMLDTEFLNTLPEEHITSGLAEMLKHGLIHSPSAWERIKNLDLGNTLAIEALIKESVSIKSEIVTKDPLEQNFRKSLNYGHTLGHAIESYFLENEGKNTLLHGEAVAVGIILATYISVELAGFPKDELDGITATILKHFPKQVFTQKDIEEVIKLLVFDKKNSNGKVLFVLLEEIGQPRFNCTVSNELIFRAFDYYKNF